MLKALRVELMKESNDKFKLSVKRFFKEPVKPYGIPLGEVRKIARKFLPETNESSLIALCDELFASGWLEEGAVALEWAMRRKIQSLPVFEKWLSKYISNWAHVDLLCCQLIGPLLEKQPELIPKVKSWTKSKNRWLRRASAVSFVMPGRHGKYLEHIFDVSEKLLIDEDDLVQKAYGWALKEASKRHQKEVFNFVMKNKDRMPRTALRYAIEKMPKALKDEAMA